MWRIFIILCILSSFLRGEKTELLVGVEQWIPFRIMDDGEYRGIDFSLWKIIEEELDISVKFEHYPWARSLHKLKTGEIDAMSGVAYTKSRAESYEYSKIPYYTCSPIFYTSRISNKKIEKYSDLYKLKDIGMVIGSAYFPKFDKDSELNKKEVATEIQLIKLLDAGRVDAIIGTGCQVDYEINRLGLNKRIVKSNFDAGYNIDLYIVFSKKSDKLELIEKINKLLEEMREDHRLEELGENYF